MGIIPSTPDIIPQPFANAGQRNVIEDTSSTPGAPNATWDQGFPPITMQNKQAGGKPPLGMDMNGVLYQLSQNAFFSQSGGVYPWNAELNYLGGAHVMGSDGREYRSLAPNGPDVPTSGGYVGAQDPTSAGGAAYWQLFGNDLFLCNRVFKLISATPPAGFVPATGTLIADAATRYPKAYAFLQTTEGQTLCVDEATWQSMSTAVYYTDAAGNQYGWEGVGGVCKFVIDINAGTIRVPDLRGLHEEAAGYNSLAVGQVACDQMRAINGGFFSQKNNENLPVVRAPSGAFVQGADTATGFLTIQGTGSAARLTPYTFDVSRVAPTGPRTAPARYGVLPCVYLGA